MELEAVRNEYGNAQLECTAADERAKLLASEVIGLEEKVVISWYFIYFFLFLLMGRRFKSVLIALKGVF